MKERAITALLLLAAGQVDVGRVNIAVESRLHFSGMFPGDPNGDIAVPHQYVFRLRANTGEVEYLVLRNDGKSDLCWKDVESCPVGAESDTDEWLKELDRDGKDDMQGPKTLRESIHEEIERRKKKSDE